MIRNIMWIYSRWSLLLQTPPWILSIYNNVRCPVIHDYTRTFKLSFLIFMQNTLMRNLSSNNKFWSITLCEYIEDEAYYCKLLIYIASFLTRRKMLVNIWGWLACTNLLIYDSSNACLMYHSTIFYPNVNIILFVNGWQCQNFDHPKLYISKKIYMLS